MNYIVVYPGSAILYTSILLLATFLARIGGSSTKYSGVATFVMVAMISIIAGARNFSVGIDTAGYISDTLSYISNGNFKGAYGEIGFKIVCKILLYISGNRIGFVLFGLAFLTHGLNILRYRDFTSEHSFGLMVFLYLCLNYLPSMNVMAQYMASAVIFWSTRYLQKQSYIKFFIGIAIATTIHATSVIGVVFFFIHIVCGKQYRKKHKIRIAIGLLLLSIVYMIGMNYLMTYTKFAHYFNTYLLGKLNKFGLMVPIKLCLLLGLLCVLLHGRRQIKQKWSSFVAYSDEGVYIANACIAGVLFQAAGYFYSYMDRLCMAFAFYEPVLLSRKAWDKQNVVTPFFKWLLIFIAIYTFYLGISTNGHGNMPYVLRW